MLRGRFEVHDGQFTPETLVSAVTELGEVHECCKKDPQFKAELKYLLEGYIGRPSRFYYAEKMTEDLGGARIYLRREGLNHTDSHRINNVLGQVLLAKKMGKTRIIAETGAGRHGMATTTAAALLGLECKVYVGKEGVDRQALNVYRMELLEAKMHPVISGTQTLRDAVNEALREWINRISDIHYVIGSVMGPHPSPVMVRDFQSVINREIKEQLMEREGRLPDMVIVCVGGGSNVMGTFYESIDEEDVKLVGCEVTDRGVETKQTAATIVAGRLNIFHGMKSYFYQNEYGRIAPVYSISAGLGYPSIGPEYAQLHDSGGAQYVLVTGDEAADSSEYLLRMEGVVPAVGNAYTVAYARKITGFVDRNQIIVINLSDRGDKDMAATARYKGVGLYEWDTAGF